MRRNFLALLLLCVSVVARGQHSGSVVGSPTFGSAKFGNGLTAVSDSNDIFLPSATWPSTLPFAAEFRGTNTGAALQVALCNDNAGSAVWLGMLANGHFGASYYGNIVDSGVAINDGAWHQSRAVFTATGIQTYVDNAAGATGSYTQSALSSTFGYIGKFSVSGYSWSGKLDEVAIWDGAYTTAAPTTAYAGTESGLRALYHLESDGTDSKSAAPATAIGVTGPSSGYVGYASSFTTSVNGSLSSGVTLTPAATGGGTFTPASITFAAGSAPAAQTFSFTAASSGTKTISFTNTGSLTNPSSISFSATAANILAVNSASWRCSPGNWYGDSGRSGAAYVKTWVPGAYCEVDFTASTSPTATLLLPTTSTADSVSYKLNGVLTDNIAATGNINISGITPSALNKLVVIVRSSAHVARWSTTAVNTVQLNGLLLDSGSTGATAPAYRPWVLVFGDSISEGIEAGASGSDDHLSSYTYLAGQAVRAAGYDLGTLACGYQGYILTGDGSGTSGDVPALYAVSSGTYTESNSRWNKIAPGISLLDSNGHISANGSTGTEPSLIWTNLATNEALQAASTSDLRAAVTGFIGVMRTAAPAAKIIIAIPFGLQWTGKYSDQSYTTALTSGFNDYVAAHPTDTRVSLFNAGAAFAGTIQNDPYTSSDNIHPDQRGQALAGTVVAQSWLNALAGAARSYTYF